MFQARFVTAIHEKRKIRLTFYSKEDADVVVRICAPMDYGPSRRARQKDNRYHLWNYESDTGQHPLNLPSDLMHAVEVSVFVQRSRGLRSRPGWLVFDNKLDNLTTYGRHESP